MFSKKFPSHDPGVLALAMLEVNPTLDFTVIDHDTHHWIREHLKAAGLLNDNVTFVLDDSVAYGKLFTKQVDFLIVDGDHSYQGVTRDIEAWWEHIRTGAYIFFHDVIDKEMNGTNGVATALQDCTKNMTLKDNPGISEVYVKND